MGRAVKDRDEEEKFPVEKETRDGDKNKHEPDPNARVRGDEVPMGVVEQRVSNLAQGSLCLVLLTGPFLHLLNLIPRGVLAGLLYAVVYFRLFESH